MLNRHQPRTLLLFAGVAIAVGTVGIVTSSGQLNRGTRFGQRTTGEADRGSGKWSLSKKLTLNDQGRSRSYRIYAPVAPPGKPCAAVLLLHGHGGSAEQLTGMKGRQAPYRLWKPIAEKESLVLIVPDGLVGSDGKQGWNDARGLATNPESDDVAFLSKLIQSVSKSCPIDAKRVYAVGTSNGGHLALRLAADASETYAAVAVVAAANPDQGFTNKPKHPVSVLFMNGTADKILPYNGGKMIRNRGKVQSTNDSIKYWIAHNQCAPTPRSFQYPDLTTRDGCTATQDTYTNAKTNVEVAVVRIDGGGHTEPSIDQPYSRLYLAITGPQNRDIEMADLIWRFFKDKAKPVER